MNPIKQKENHLTQLIEHLWASNAEGKSPQVFAIVCGAMDKRLEPKINNSGLEHRCLYSDVKHYALKRSAPHLVKLTSDHPLTHELLTEGWGRAWAMYIVTYTPVDIANLRHHFRRLGKVQTPDGRSLIFRYYDPRVLRPLLPTCDTAQLRQLFPDAAQFILEGGDSRKLIRCWLDEQRANLTINTSVVSQI